MKSSASEAINKSASAANTIRGAVKAGKAVSGAAKGTAVGGPYGALAMTIWENRKIIAKVGIGLIAFMLLPIVVISMLPSILFGSGSSSAETDNGDYNWDESVVEEALINDDTVIFENVEQASDAADEVMALAHSTVIDQIYSDFSGYGANAHIEIIDPYSSALPHDSIEIICQYSASDNGGDSINIDKLNELLNAHSDEYYSYTVDTSTYPVTTQVQNEDGTRSDVTVMHTNIKSKLLSGVDTPDNTYTLCCDGYADVKTAVLFACDFDLQRLSDFKLGIETRGMIGIVFCFDYQSSVLAEYFGNTASLRVIDSKKLADKFGI